MRWKKGRLSNRVDDRRGRRVGRAGAGLSGGALVIVVVVSLLLGQNPLEMLGLVDQFTAGNVVEEGGGQPADDEQTRFVRAILGETEDAWGEIFNAAGGTYQPPTLVLFTGSVRSACGSASAAVGPFYCPGDRQVYIDLSFFRELHERFGAAGDFAQAYVIAHEVGHHIQTLTGVSQQVNDARRSGQRVEGADGLLVRQELQADCLAGLWAHHAQRRLDWMEAGDLEEAITAAGAIGDDTLQRRSQGQVVPDAFTHGSAAQRVRWFRMGFESGDMKRCDTFNAARL